MKFARYLLVQVLAYGLDMGVFLIFTNWVHGSIVWANLLAKIIAGTFAYFTHHHFTFQSAGQALHGKSMTRYVLLLALNTPISTLLLLILVKVLSPEALAKVVGDGLCVAVTYLVSKRFIFAVKKESANSKFGT